ncbi:YqaJ viral recombinase family protein [Agitococcus lubricus]|uniref:Putative phage-type endonuclease n=1 Tax=Agitococcus lubricus TaxID=1077255 RepID=A0A2T5J081_9GAMM|nr:YqaJ viral recombinase family protein [Agitococcus lubricus]PTQ89644.1 putative phage-type endonuclease [Agitococcus lubricus]
MEYQHTERSPSTSLAAVSHQPLAIGTATPVNSDNSLSLTVLSEQSTKAHTHTANAIRLINTKGLSRSEWLAVRRQGIGGSDAAAAVGLNPYQSQLELWMIKTGRFSEDNIDSEANHHSSVIPDIDSKMYWGQILEPIIAQHYTKVTGRKVRKVNAILQHADSDKSWMLANIDYRVVGSDEVQLLECKTAGEYGAKLWKDGVPEYVECQVQHQLAVTGLQAADVCVLICGQQLKIYRIERDEELIAKLIELERLFWHYVQSNIPPCADGSESAGIALRCLFPQDYGQTVDFSNNTHVLGLFDSLINTRKQLSFYQQQEEFYKQLLQQNLGEASYAQFSQGSLSWKKAKDSVYLDTTALAKDHPQLCQQYQRSKVGSRRFLVYERPVANTKASD